ncbi:bifunctional hydroxymethylpyrimidine kinase/phosphomethylpyrimidine kinase [Lactobacillus sp. PV034]|uniref:bifunctional hydroxymethylpyrimidine kinase/phosphomethylpyrimidine kinase n=1 Tax=Lactobacillus sp. PV034 TaxID=2594495 RepID=UPI00224027F3|nr:bifunctional hydroxymethylpyrimidine kinase/phosphomethylpyrimidine kinase [Lactobacillus sp. PV034]QNQ81228.1 bifunctional hydroxymethylpyrimidine kinase/phosphomethylpyrimidine kinase [Lactobacillus sp. PV034]
MTELEEHAEALTIAGNDSDGSAGMPADLHTFYALGVYGLGLLTSAVAGNSKGIFAQQLMPVDFINRQFQVLNDDYVIKASKTGMLGSKEVIHAVAENLKKFKMQNIVVDPVITTKHGATLLEDEAYQTFLDELIPLATIITPNFYEAQKLAEIELNNDDDIRKAAQILQNMGAKNVLIKGKHTGDESEVRDYLLLEDSSEIWLSKPYFETNRVNGTGDTLSATIAAELAKGNDIKNAVEIAKDFTYYALSHPIKVGTLYGPINHGAAQKDYENKQ